jgi:hypothetical protein
MGLTWQAGGPIFVSPDRCCLPKKAFAIGCLSAAGLGRSPPAALKLSKARPSDGADARLRRGGYQQDSDGAEQSPTNNRHAVLCGCLQPAPDPSPSTKRRRFSTNAPTCWSWGASSCNLHGRRSIGPRRRLLAGIGTSDDRLSPATPSADHSGLDPGHNVVHVGVPVVAGAIYSK